jgi:hypothetical protein
MFDWSFWMKPFNLQAAIKGAPVVTRSGLRIIDFHYAMHDTTGSPIFAQVEGSSAGHWYQLDGNRGTNDSTLDLFMAPVKKTFYVNFYIGTHSTYHAKEYDARVYAESTSGAWAIAVPVELEV